MIQIKVLLAGNESLDQKKILTGRKYRKDNEEKAKSRKLNAQTQAPRTETRDPRYEKNTTTKFIFQT